jgi:thiol-disulfide isomerase/thioredoxin
VRLLLAPVDKAALSSTLAIPSTVKELSKNMSTPTNVKSEDEWDKIVSSSAIVIADCRSTIHTPEEHLSPADQPALLVHADWCAPCKQIAPIFEKLSTQFSETDKVTFCKVDVERLRVISMAHDVRVMPTFLVLKDGGEIYRVSGADPQRLTAAVEWAIDPKEAKAKGLVEPAFGTDSLFSTASILAVIAAFIAIWLITLFSVKGFVDYFLVE